MESNPIENKHLETSAWRAEYDRALDELFKNPEGLTLDKILDVVLKQGILARIAPSDNDVKQSRIDQDKDVWSGNQEDKNLYAQLFYAVENSKEAMHLTADFSWINSVYAALGRIFRDEKMVRRFFNPVKNMDEHDSAKLIFFKKLQGRILDEYKKHGGENDLYVIPQGSCAIFHNIPVVIDGYNPNGTIRIKAESEEGHRNLYQYTGGLGLKPADIFSSDFKLVEK